MLAPRSWKHVPRSAARKTDLPGWCRRSPTCRRSLARTSDLGDASATDCGHRQPLYGGASRRLTAKNVTAARSNSLQPSQRRGRSAAHTKPFGSPIVPCSNRTRLLGMLVDQTASCGIAKQAVISNHSADQVGFTLAGKFTRSSVVSQFEIVAPKIGHAAYV